MADEALVQTAPVEGTITDDGDQSWRFAEEVVDDGLAETADGDTEGEGDDEGVNPLAGLSRDQIRKYLADEAAAEAKAEIEEQVRFRANQATEDRLQARQKAMEAQAREQAFNADIQAVSARGVGIAYQHLTDMMTKAIDEGREKLEPQEVNQVFSGIARGMTAFTVEEQHKAALAWLDQTYQGQNIPAPAATWETIASARSKRDIPQHMAGILTMTREIAFQEGARAAMAAMQNETQAANGTDAAARAVRQQRQQALGGPKPTPVRGASSSYRSLNDAAVAYANDEITGAQYMAFEKKFRGRTA